MESGATPAGVWEPAGDLGPVQGQQATDQSQLGPASAPASPGSTVPASDPNTVPATALLPAPAPAPVNALLPAPAPALAPTWSQSQIKGLKAYTGCLLYFIFVIFYFKFILQSLTPTPHQNISSSSPLYFFSSTF